MTSSYFVVNLEHVIVNIGVSIPLKNHPLFLSKPPLNQQTVPSRFLGNPLLYIGFS